MIIMSVDYGDVRTGIAVCDKNEILATPVCVISEDYQPKLIEKISQLAGDKKAELFVVGYPKNMDGSVGDRGVRCAEMAAALSKATGISAVLWDERLTTVSAYTQLNAAGKKGSQKKKVVDEVAAVIILQSYIDSGSRADERKN